MDSLNVVHITTSYPRYEGDDAGIFIERLCKAIKALGIKISVIVPRDKIEEDSYSPIKVSRVPYSKLFMSNGVVFGAGIGPNIKRRPWLILQFPFLIFSLYKSLKKSEKISLVHAHWLLAGFSALLYYNKTKTPYVVSIRGVDSKIISSKFGKIIVYPVLKKAKKVITVNSEFKLLVERSFPELISSIVTISNGVDAFDGESSFPENVPKGAPYILFIGRVIPLKRVEHIVEAMRSLPEYNLVICGRCEDSEYLNLLNKKIEEDDIKSRVHFTGAVKPTLIPNYLKNAHCLVAPSSYEGRSNVILEAMSCETPIIASDIPSHKEILKDRENSLILGTDLVGDIIKFVNELNSSQEQRRVIIQNAKTKVKEFSWERSANEHLALYKSVLENNV